MIEKNIDLNPFGNNRQTYYIFYTCMRLSGMPIDLNIDYDGDYILYDGDRKRNACAQRMCE